jgi:hypothetical protein
MRLVRVGEEEKENKANVYTESEMEKFWSGHIFLCFS